MPRDAEYQAQWGTALVTFGQNGTYSAPLSLSRRIVGIYADAWPGAAGSIVMRAATDPSGTGYPVQTNDGTVLKILAFGSGTYYSFNVNAPAPLMPYVVLQVGTAGTAGIAGGGTMVLVTAP